MKWYIKIWRAKDSDYWLKLYPPKQIRQIIIGKRNGFCLINWVRGLGIIKLLK